MNRYISAENEIRIILSRSFTTQRLNTLSENNQLRSRRTSSNEIKEKDFTLRRLILSELDFRNNSIPLDTNIEDSDNSIRNIVEHIETLIDFLSNREQNFPRMSDPEFSKITEVMNSWDDDRNVLNQINASV